mmetsp:Transcript_13118/g.48675  ORF Transcript_13118/g.48675 Transcript_13118/m.48675 type:complete len:286 (-) Transcript_13118:202-1059(-)
MRVGIELPAQAGLQRRPRHHGHDLADVFHHALVGDAGAIDHGRGPHGSAPFQVEGKLGVLAQRLGQGGRDAPRCRQAGLLREGMAKPLGLAPALCAPVLRSGREIGVGLRQALSIARRLPQGSFAAAVGRRPGRWHKPRIPPASQRLLQSLPRLRRGQWQTSVWRDVPLREVLQPSGIAKAEGHARMPRERVDEGLKGLRRPRPLVRRGAEHIPMQPTLAQMMEHLRELVAIEAAQRDRRVRLVLKIQPQRHDRIQVLVGESPPLVAAQRASRRPPRGGRRDEQL